MPFIINHREIRILVMEAGEAIEDHGAPGDIAIELDDAGWWTRFIGADSEIESYDTPFETYTEALNAAKSAAEFGF
jgi:hypothetical protein